MSLPNTPARSIALSTVSTPFTIQHGTSPQQLTPRSKVKAMLAAIDDGSDSEPIKQDLDPQRTALSTITGNVRRVETQKIRGQEIDATMEEESKNDSLVKPRGRLAARLAGQVPDKAGPATSNGYESIENAYARIKKQLVRGDTRNAHGPFSEAESDIAEPRESTPQSITPSVRATLRSALDLSPPRSNSTTGRRSSPGMFVTPESNTGRHKSPEKRASNDGSDSDLPAEPQANSRFLELVAKKRAEREAKQAEENREREGKTARQREFEKDLSQDALSDSGLSDEERATETKLQSRPTRKASKKALEEMNRETQRMSRNMQLAHQAKTKKKITKDSLFARFNFRVPAASTAGAAQNLSSSTAASSAPVTDAEDAPRQESPPTSPVEPEASSKAPSDLAVERQPPSHVEAMYIISGDDELPSMLEIMSQPILKVDKGKGKATGQIDATPASDSNRGTKYNFTQPPIKVRPPKPSLRPSNSNLDSDSELEVVPNRKKKHSKFDVFDRQPPGKVQVGRSLQTLRALAHLNSPEKQAHGKRATMSLADLQRSLQSRARKQAVEERAAKIEDLKSRGIIVQTPEERQKDQAEVEDLLEKARKECEEIHQKEKRAAKKAKIANGEVDDLPDTSDEDDEYEEEEEPDVELSGSEEGQVENLDGTDNNASDDEDSPNEDDEEGDISLETDEPIKNGFVDDEASERGDDEQEGLDVDDRSEEDEEAYGPQIHRFRRNKMVVADDDDDDNMQEKVAPTQSQTPAVQIQCVPPIFGDSKNMVVPMGMTQAFAATMADTQTQAYENDEEQDSLAFLGLAPEPDVLMFDVDDMVEDSQKGLQFSETNKEIDLHFSQSQIRYDALGNTQGDTQSLPIATQMSEMPDPTQDVGFIMSSPAPPRFASPPPSTVDTVLLPGAAGIDSPVKKNRGRLQRRAVIEEDSSDYETIPVAEKLSPANAFDAMERAKKRAAAAATKEAFNKKKSEAKGMVEEHAQESEDEFQGIGGPSDDESGGEDDEYIREMIDQGEVDVDERQLAALYADRERASDEKAVEKLFKDINSGMLRRKRGADVELSDSDDDAEARQRRKRQEFAKMRKVLLENENVGKIAEDPKKLAFLRAIEDREYDEDLDFLDRPAEDSFRVETGTQDEPDSKSQQQHPTALEANIGKRRRPLEDALPDKANMRPPPAARRTATAKKPATLAEIRESVSFLIEEPGSINLGLDPSSSASEDETTHNEQHRNPRRTSPKKIVDRLSLKRAESASTSSTTRFAFHNPSATNNGFKVPSLLRRATTTQLNANAADANGISTAAATERAAGGGEKGDFVRRGGTKRSSVNFYSREKERKSVVEQVEKRRKGGREKEAKRRRSGLGEVGTGAFE